MTAVLVGQESPIAINPPGDVDWSQTHIDAPRAEQIRPLRHLAAHLRRVTLPRLYLISAAVPGAGIRSA